MWDLLQIILPLWASVAVNEENIYIHSGQEQERALENENQEKFHK